MIGGISSGAAEGGDAGADFTGLVRRLRALLTRDLDAGSHSRAPRDQGTGGGAHPVPPVDVPPSRSSLEQLAGLERLHGKNEDLPFGPLLRAVVCEVPRLLVEIVSCDVDVHAHDEDLRTVLRNLLMNVRDHAGGRAVITCRTEERRVRVTIEDNGPGLRPMQLATLFQRGARGPGSNGLGLGLHVARLLCRRQGGDLRLLRGVGGCTFEIVLWAAGGPEDPDALPSQRRGHGAPAPAPSSAGTCEG
jgi:signal transduction histidine kinase